MDGWVVAWLLWAGGFAAIEGAALVVKDRPNRPATLSAHVWWLISGAAWWHRLARVVLLCGLAWLSVHLLSGGWV
jgi:hypothetical protein